MLVVLAKRLAKMNLVVKNLMTVDTLGLVSALCIGKTGTLTRNEKTVSHVWIDNEIYPVKDSKNGRHRFRFNSYVGAKSLTRILTFLTYLQLGYMYFRLVFLVSSKGNYEGRYV